MNKTLAGATLILSLMITLTAMQSPAGAINVPHAMSQCKTCHYFSEATGSMHLKERPSDLCLTCHSQYVPPTHHEVDLRPAGTPDGLPLYRGLMTCVTCHEPHGMAPFPKLLRSLPSTLCAKCHKK